MYKNEKVLNYALHDKVTLSKDGKEITILKKGVGQLFLPTGKIVANDPIVNAQMDEFTIAVHPGTYAVFVHHIPDTEHNVLASIRFSGKKPVKWEMACVKEQNIEDLDGDGFFGYDVDAGTGGFMDKEVCHALEMLFHEEEEDNTSNFFQNKDGKPVKTVINVSEQHSQVYPDGNHTVANKDHNIATFTSGWGDGSYPSYFGIDADGKPCILVTDFLFLDNPNTSHAQ